jgi:hypothetical protein
MIARRKSNLHLPPRMYEYKGRRTTTYYTITAENKRINLGHDLAAAKRKLLELEEGRSIAGTIGELLDDYLKTVSRKVEQGKRSQRTLDDREAEILNLKKAFGKMAPDDLHPRHVWDYLHKYRGTAAPVRANREVAFLQSAFNWARGQGIVRDNPCVGVERNEETPRDRLVTDKELRGFCKMAWRRGEAGKRVALAAAIAYLTGKAQGQILRLSRSQLGDEGIEFGKRKGGARTLVRWSRRLARYVKAAIAMPCQIKPMYVIHNQQGSPYTSDGFKTIWQKLMREWVAAGNERFTFHDLRAKAASDVIEQGRKASELTGHRSEAMPARVYDRRRIRKADAVR